MRTISLQKAFNLLQNCSAVILDQNGLIYPALDEIRNNDENEFMYLEWTDSEGYEFNVKFKEENNKEVTIDGITMILKDNEGYESALYLLNPSNLEDLINE